MSKCVICSKTAKNDYCKKHYLDWKRVIWSKHLNYLPVEQQAKYILNALKAVK